MSFEGFFMEGSVKFYCWLSLISDICGIIGQEETPCAKASNKEARDGVRKVSGFRDHQHWNITRKENNFK